MTSALSGKQLLSGNWSASGDRTFACPNRPAQTFFEATVAEINLALEAADRAWPEFATLNRSARAKFLRTIAAEIEALGDELLELAHAETYLPLPRLTGERARTTGQLRMFADLIEKGECFDARLDSADPNRQPAPKPEIRSIKAGMGPVAVFGASNFPLAFSVAGGDTASALAAGCPVVCKAHPAHPGTSEMVGRAILAAISECKLNPGIFALLHGGAEVGAQLAVHPKLAAIGFTGSRRGGDQLVRLGMERSRPIPVFAEMGSVNPVVVLPGVLKSDSDRFATAYVQSLTLGAGQFCTNPGILIGIGDAFEACARSIADGLNNATVHPMLTPAIASGLETCIAKQRSQSEVKTLSKESLTDRWFGMTTAAPFVSNPSLSEEMFGPSALAVRCNSVDEIHQVIASFEGELTMSIHFQPEEMPTAKALVQEMMWKSGRVIANGFPTGVEVCGAMHHGGPYPATSDSRFTSVGTRAIDRWLRPVCFQDMPLEFLPEGLKH